MANGTTKNSHFSAPVSWGRFCFSALFAVVAWILFRFAAPTQTYEEKRAQERRDKVAAINADAQQKLYGARQSGSTRRRGDRAVAHRPPRWILWSTITRPNRCRLPR